ncbi:MAG: hypothetical protein OEV40_30900, partial [Acidimicrobiia bacterium]|nr:hypothetical protein [Acidimicrobiia bacterium]
MKRSIAVVLVMVLASATLSTQAAAREDRDGPGATEANVSLSNFGIADTMAPTVTVIVPENGTTYTQGATVPAN